jgi:hypothetical protein
LFERFKNLETNFFFAKSSRRWPFFLLQSRLGSPEWAALLLAVLRLGALPKAAKP